MSDNMGRLLTLDILFEDAIFISNRRALYSFQNICHYVRYIIKNKCLKQKYSYPVYPRIKVGLP